MTGQFKPKHSIWNEMWINMGMPDADDILTQKSYPNILSLEVMQALQMSEAENMHLREELEFTQKRMTVYKQKVAEMQGSLTKYINQRNASDNVSQSFVTEEDNAKRTVTDHSATVTDHSATVTHHSGTVTHHSSTQTDQIALALKCKQHCKYYTNCEECILKAELDPDPDMLTLSDIDIQTDPVEKKLKTRHSQTCVQKNQFKSTCSQTIEVILEDKETETSADPYAFPNRATNKCTQTAIVHSRVKNTQTTFINRKHKSIQTMVSEDELPEEIKIKIENLRSENLLGKQHLQRVIRESLSLLQQKDATIEQQSGQIRTLSDTEERAKKQIQMVADNLNSFKQEKNETQKACRKHLLQHEAKLKAKDQEFTKSRLIFAEYRRNHIVPNGAMAETRRLCWDEIETLIRFMKTQATYNGHFPVHCVFDILEKLRYNVDIKLWHLTLYCQRSYKDDPILSHPKFAGIACNVGPESVKRSVTRFDKSVDNRPCLVSAKAEKSTDDYLPPRKSSSDHAVVLMRREYTSIQSLRDTAAVKTIKPHQDIPTEDDRLDEGQNVRVPIEYTYRATSDDGTQPLPHFKILRRADRITRKLRKARSTNTDTATAFEQDLCDGLADEYDGRKHAENVETASKPNRDGPSNITVMNVQNEGSSVVVRPNNVSNVENNVTPAGSQAEKTDNTYRGLLCAPSQIVSNSKGERNSSNDSRGRTFLSASRSETTGKSESTETKCPGLPKSEQDASKYWWQVETKVLSSKSSKSANASAGMNANKASSLIETWVCGVQKGNFTINKQWTISDKSEMAGHNAIPLCTICHEQIPVNELSVPADNSPENEEPGRELCGACRKQIPDIELPSPADDPPENSPQRNPSNSPHPHPDENPEEEEESNSSFNFFNLNQWTFLGSVFNQN